MAGPLGAVFSEWLLCVLMLNACKMYVEVMTWVICPILFVYRLLVRTRPKKFSCILITGASSGIGAALARAYAEPGVKLVLAARRADRLAEVRASCEARGAVVVVLVVDVTDHKAMQQHILELDDQTPFDLVIANAGVQERAFQATVDTYLGETQVAVSATNVMGVVHTLSPILPRMCARKSGQVVIMASLMGLTTCPLKSTAAYAASKAWAVSYGSGLRGALRRDGVGVTTICAGFVESEMLNNFLAVEPGKGRWQRMFGIDADTAARRMQQAIAYDTAQFLVPFNLGVPAVCFSANNIVTPSIMWLGPWRWLADPAPAAQAKKAQ